MSWLIFREILCLVFVTGGVFFFVAGTVGLLRFSDPLSRLHALTKADNLGLGLIVLGLSLHAWEPWEICKWIVIWLLVIGSSAAASQLVAATVCQESEIEGESKNREENSP